MKILVAVLAKKFGVKPRGWEKHAAGWHTVADVDSVETMAHAREVKREMKGKAEAALDVFEKNMRRNLTEREKQGIRDNLDHLHRD